MNILNEVGLSGLSVGIANICTSPLDMIKVRMQLSKNEKNIYKIGANIIKTEGFLSLWSGIGPSIARGFFFGGARLGLYTPIKNRISNDLPPNFYQKMLAGSISGGLAAMVTSPIELIKTNLQSKKSNNKNSTQVIKDIIKKHGLIGLWNGSIPGLLRSSLLTASQCAIYDESKKTLKHYIDFHEGFKLHIFASMISGLVTTTITSPLDVIKTNMYTGNVASKGMIHCTYELYKINGIPGFFSGWSASYLRLGPHTMIMFVSAEYFRKMYGLISL